MITGGTGFVGSHLVEELLAQNQTNIHVTSFGSNPSFVSSILPAENIHKLDLTDQKATFELVKKLKPAQIYHLAAYAAVGKSFEQTRKVLDTNLDIQLNVLESVKNCCPQTKILVIGSAMEYDMVNTSDQIDEKFPLGPVSPYAVSKVMQDLLGLSYFYSYKLKVIRVRPFNHIGERQTKDFAIPSFAHQIVEIEKGTKDHIEVGNLDAIRDFTDVKDMVKAYILLMEKGQIGDVYNVGTGQGKIIKEVLDLLCQLSSSTITIQTDPQRIRPLDIPTAVANNSKIKSLGWTPTIPLEKTLERILNYWRNEV